MTERSSLLNINEDIWLSLTEEGLMPRFLLAVMNDLPESHVESVEDVSVEELENSPVAGITMRKGGFTNLAGFCISCKIDGVQSEVILLNEEIPYIKWWHDKSFFTLNYYNEHIKCLKGLSVKSKVRRRIVLSFLLDKDINLDKFHTVNSFLTDDGKGGRVKDTTFQVHDINFLCIPDEDTKLAHWCRLLIATDMNEIARIAQNHQLG